MVRALLVVVLAFLAGCEREPEQREKAASEPTTAMAEVVGSSGESREPASSSSKLFFVGRWASEAANCPQASWVITQQGLQTPGEVTCRFHRVAATTRGADVEATCTAEGPPRPWTLRFAYAQSARALLIENAPFADIGLVRCDNSTRSGGADVEASVAAEVPRISDAQTAAAAGMVSIRSLVPDMHLEMRYASDTNFVGKRVRGYEAARCYLLKPVAEALRRVERALREQAMRLKIFDCYRPVRAVQRFVEWAADLNDQKTKSRYYPNLEKSALLGDYIAPTSSHSRGATVDLTLMHCEDDGECAGLDMGTDFDFFDVLAHTDSPHITPQQRENRQRLRAAMEQEGFQNYPMEWWHYTFEPEPSKGVAYDFPVQ